MKRVLIADDEPIERMIVSRTVEKYFSEELTVVSAANGREAVEQFFAGDCQIALLDIEMPGMNGLEAAEQIRKRDKNCSIIFLTAFDEFNYAKRAIAVRAMEYLLKPVEDQELVAVLEEAVRIAEEQETDREAGEKKSAEQISAERDCHEDTADTERSRIRLQAVAGNIQAFIEHNYMDDISLQTVAEAMNYSDAYFCKIFKQCFDKNFIVYLSEYRVARAKELLGDVLINVKDVSQKVGYRDSNYFAKVFKRIVLHLVDLIQALDIVRRIFPHRKHGVPLLAIDFITALDRPGLCVALLSNLRIAERKLFHRSSGSFYRNIQTFSLLAIALYVCLKLDTLFLERLCQFAHRCVIL